MEIRICICGCGKKFECNEKSKRKYFALGHQSTKNLKGKTYEEIYGKKRASEKKLKQSKRQTGKKLNRKKPSYKKGKTYEEIYGKERSNQIKKKAIEKNILNGTFWTKEKIMKNYLDMPKIRKMEMVLYRKLGKLPDRKTINKFFGSLEKFIKITKKPFLPNLKKCKHVGHNEKQILDIIEKNKNIKLLRQYHIGKFFVDGYDKLNNIVYEVDEYHHKNQKIEDEIRENKIKKILNCKIIRINEKDFLNSCQLNLEHFIIR